MLVSCVGTAHTHTHAHIDTYTHVAAVSGLRLGHVKAGIDRVLFRSTAIASLCVFPTLTTRLNVPTCSLFPTVCFISFALLRGNLQCLWQGGSSVSVPTDHQTSLQLRPLTTAYATLSSSSHQAQNRAREIVYIERERGSDQKEQRERVIGSIERRFFSPVAQGRFH